MATRKQISDAVLARLVATGAFNLYGKRNRDPESLTNPALLPAVFLFKHGENNQRRAPNLPNIRELRFRAILYIDVTANENAIPMDVFDDLFDAIDAAFAPDDLGSGRCTLGGLVYSALIEGDSVVAAGDVSGKGLAVIPINVIVP